jgi:hypothetical protein
VIIIPGEKRGTTLEGYGADSREQVSKEKRSKRGRGGGGWDPVVLG